MRNRLNPWQVSLRSVFVVIAVVGVGIGLTTRVGFTVLASVPVGLAYGFVAGGIIGSLARTRKQSIQGGVVGAFVTHFAVLLDSAVSAFAATGPWSLQSFVVLAPVGAIAGAFLAIRPSLGLVKSVVISCIAGPVIAAVYVVAIFAFTRWRELLMYPTETVSSLRPFLIVWCVAGLLIGLTTGVTMGVMNKVFKVRPREAS